MSITEKKPYSKVVAGEIQSTRGYIRRQVWTNPILADADRLKNDQASSNTVVTTITTFLAQPDFPRNITITPGGTTGSVPAANVVVTGTNIRGEVISENILLTENGSSLVSGAKAFKTVTSIVLPIQDGAGATYDIGVGDVLGLDRKMSEAAVVDVFAAGVRETTAVTVTFSATVTTAVTVTFSATAVESNTINPDTALDGAVDFAAYFISTEKTSSSATTS